MPLFFDLFSFFSKCCSGDLKDLVSSHKTVLLQKEQQTLLLEEKGKQLQKEVWPRETSVLNYLFFDFFALIFIGQKSHGLAITIFFTLCTRFYIYKKRRNF